MADDPSAPRKRSMPNVEDEGIDASEFDETALIIGGGQHEKLVKKASRLTLEILSDDHDQQQPMIQPKSRPSWKNYAMLLIIYFCQGIPMGLVFGTIPFLLGERSEGSSAHMYASIGLFSLASQPYNLKLLWSPIVDSIYDKRLGRRKSWIIPLQFLIGFIFFYIGYLAPELFPPANGVDAQVPVFKIACLFGLLICSCATQDIAVDGWALTLLDRDHLRFSSTCQTIGTNAGYFFSFTVYLSLASADFCNRYLRSAPGKEGILDFGSFLQVCSVIYLCITILLFKMKPESRELTCKTRGVRGAYSQIFTIFRLSNVQILAWILLLGKIGFMAGDTLTPLKLLERGFHKESLALVVLIDFACQLMLSCLSVKVVDPEKPLKSWQAGCLYKTLFSLMGLLLVSQFPADGMVTTGYFFLVTIHSILSSCASTLMLISLNSFFSTISDPAVGGTYVTLLNTLSNLGSSWPRLLALWSVDRFTGKICRIDPMMASSMSGIFDDTCGSDEAVATCHRLGGTCATITDGYVIVMGLSVTIGLLVMRVLVRRLVWRIEGSPISTWRIT